MDLKWIKTRCFRCSHPNCKFTTNIDKHWWFLYLSIFIGFWGLQNQKCKDRRKPLWHAKSLPILQLAASRCWCGLPDVMMTWVTKAMVIPCPGCICDSNKKNNDDSTVRDGEKKISHHFMIMVWNSETGPLILFINKATMKTNMAPPMVHRSMVGNFAHLPRLSEQVQHALGDLTFRSWTTGFSDRCVTAEGNWIIAKPETSWFWERWFFMKNLRNLKLQ